MALDWEQGALAEGLACYRRREFFETHEHWESVWMYAVEPEKTFLQALIHVSVGFHHLQRGNEIGAQRQFGRAEAKLAPYPAEFCGINVSAIRSSLAAWLESLQSGEPTSAIPFPIIL